jgi:hypothetical protein
MRKAAAVLPVLLLASISVSTQGAAAARAADNRSPARSLSLFTPAASPRLAVSIFLGRGGNDIFSTLHDQYTWKLLGRSMTVGVGLYREIPLSKGVGLLPYVGVIRASATLRPSALYGNRESFEYGLTAFCVGLPLVLRFN